jgi:hypothetical protein
MKEMFGLNNRFGLLVVRRAPSVITVVGGLTGHHHYVCQHLNDYTEIEFKFTCRSCRF